MWFAKRNRQRLKEADKYRMRVGPRPVTGIHKESRKAKEKKEKLAVKKFFR